MGRVTVLMYQNTGTTIDAETAMTDFSPPINGRLKKVIINPGGIAATSLIESGYVKLTCATFGGVDMYAPFKGIGLETVPRDDKPICVTECDLAIKAGQPIKGYYYYNVTPVTPELFVFGEIEG